MGLEELYTRCQKMILQLLHNNHNRTLHNHVHIGFHVAIAGAFLRPFWGIIEIQKCMELGRRCQETIAARNHVFRTVASVAYSPESGLYATDATIAHTSHDGDQLTGGNIPSELYAIALTKYVFEKASHSWGRRPCSRHSHSRYWKQDICHPDWGSVTIQVAKVAKDFTKPFAS